MEDTSEPDGVVSVKEEIERPKVPVRYREPDGAEDRVRKDFIEGWGAMLNS